jgi:hypothetical protein
MWPSYARLPQIVSVRRRRDFTPTAISRRVTTTSEYPYPEYLQYSSKTELLPPIVIGLSLQSDDAMAKSKHLIHVVLAATFFGGVGCATSPADHGDEAGDDGSSFELTTDPKINRRSGRCAHPASSSCRNMRH